ncbi:phosphatidylglycerol lysyltransferase domain-containing protein [Synergistaceae bacterium OttesenSCG-928-D05]|nr:phosphatidylglycerol lysyltransferase domain-containing protein [Synergistaceae bacterium OttesenSCG-928-D05]
MELNFKNIELADVVPYMEHWEETDQQASDYSFPILWGWAQDYGYQTAVEKESGLFWIRQTVPDIYNLAPIGDWQRDTWEQLITERFGKKCEFWLVPERLLDVWKAQFGDRLEAEDDRGNWEYLYHIADLASLAGNKYMRKRNRVNQFRRRYDYVYKPITHDVIPEVIRFQEAWCQANDCGTTPGLLHEHHGILRILNHWCEIPHMRGGLIEVGGRIVAYTIGELSESMLIVHFEKASLEYSAAYQAINQEFLAHILEEKPEIKIVNREEDMNDPGLRDAKMSYLPVDFIKKYHVKIKL